jgi:hypothetical protein
MNEHRGNLYLLTGLIIGMAVGLLFAWVISPVKYVDTEPGSLAGGVKDEYRQVIALAYQANHDLGRARQRIALIDPGSDFKVLAAQAQRMLADDTTSQEARALAVLAADMSKPPVEIAAPQISSTITSTVISAETQAPTSIDAEISKTPAEVAAIQTPTPRPSPTLPPTLTFTPAPTFTPRPTATPKRALEAPFILKQKREVCDKSISPGLLQIQVMGSDGKPLSGVQIVILTKNGQDTFYTGLYPEIGPGYADFVMTAGEVYSLKVGDVSEIAEGIAIPACGGGLLMEFEEGKK